MFGIPAQVAICPGLEPGQTLQVQAVDPADPKPRCMWCGKELAKPKMNRKNKPRPVPNKKLAAKGGRRSSRKGVPNKKK
jgi:hypothetical protein